MEDRVLLITGASGFLGQHIKKLFPHALAPDSVELNLMCQPVVDAYFEAYKPSKILHLAGVCGGIEYNRNNPAIMLHNNSTMALNLFEAARKRFGVEEIITIGSTCQYPLSLKPPFKTEDMWNGYPEPTNGPYGISKRFVYELGEAYQKQYQINHKHIVLANLYGPGDDFGSRDSHVIPSLIHKFSTEDCVEIWGSPETKREFLYVEDAAKIVKDLVNKRFSGAVNVGSGEQVTIEALAGKIADIIRWHGDVVFNVDMPSGQMDRLLDSKYKGKTKLMDGLKKTIIWYRGNR